MMCTIQVFLRGNVMVNNKSIRHREKHEIQFHITYIKVGMMSGE